MIQGETLILERKKKKNFTDKRTLNRNERTELRSGSVGVDKTRKRRGPAGKRMNVDHELPGNAKGRMKMKREDQNNSQKTVIDD